MKQKAKKVIMPFLLAVILAGCFWIMFQNREVPLLRERDKEFISGSQIKIGEISKEQQESLYKLCKIWGYAKYYHPSVTDGTLNWDAELFRVMPEVLNSENQTEVNEVLYQWLNQFPFALEETKDGQEWLTLQSENGFQSLDTSWLSDRDFLGEEVCSYLEKLSKTLLTERENGYAAFEGDMPYVNFDNESMLPFKPEDDGVKLLALFRFWNAYEYYSPNLAITRADWDTVLKEAIPKVLAADNYRDFVLAMAHVTAQTADAHIVLRDRENILGHYYGKQYLPCRVKNVNGELVVSAVSESSGELKKGDILEKIDGVSMKDRLSELKEYFVLPEEDKFLLKLEHLLLQTEGKTARVEVLRGTEKLDFSLNTMENLYQPPKLYPNGLMENGTIGYIDPSELKKGEVESLMEEFKDTDGLIVDLRQYPTVSLPYLLGEYITPEPKKFAILTFPNRALPGSFYFIDEFETGAGVMKKMGSDKTCPSYGGKVILLMDETSMSQSEFTIMALRQSPHAVVVGSPSLGADGNIVKLSLPGNLVLQFTGLGVYTPEGEETQRVGLTPDVECYPTAEGLREGRDELVEKAVELIATP